jgi:hypothetical protein
MKTFAAILLLCATFGCSSFERDWRAATETNSTGIEGRWIGRWNSDSNGHNDILRCLVTKKTDTIYETRFHAKYSRWIIPLSFGYALDMNVTAAEGVYQFRGQADLGMLAGGGYQYTGEGNTTELRFNYNAEKDRGTFRLQRPASGD